MKKQKIIIAGYGEIGQAIHQFYNQHDYELSIVDIDVSLSQCHCDILHICFPYSDNFIVEVEKYISLFSPHLVIIHSTIYPGTSENIKFNNLVYSPVVGVHPHLHECIKIFKKFVAGKTKQSIIEACNHFSELGIASTMFKCCKSLETAKTLCTLYYGMCIAFHDEVHDLCKKESIDYSEVMTLWNSEYNSGYKKIGKDNVIRPVLSPAHGKIGGHCVIPNAEMIASYFNSPIIDYVLRLK
jgi:UDP-N-acetyl-D-mannosaminuronate dehydrogenase